MVPRIVRSLDVSVTVLVSMSGRALYAEDVAGLEWSMLFCVDGVLLVHLVFEEFLRCRKVS